MYDIFKQNWAAKSIRILEYDIKWICSHFTLCNSVKPDFWVI